MPPLKLAAVLRDPAIASGAGQYAVIQAAAPSFGVELRAVGVRDAGEIERTITAFARSSNGGLVVTGRPHLLHATECLRCILSRISPAAAA